MQRISTHFPLDRSNAAKYQHISMLAEFWKHRVGERLDTTLHLQVEEFVHASPETRIFPWCSAPSVFVPMDDRLVFLKLEGNLCKRCIALAIPLKADPHYNRPVLP